MPGDMDVDAGRIIEGGGTLSEVGLEIHDRVLALGTGARTVSEELGHREFILTYKTFGPRGLPAYRLHKWDLERWGIGSGHPFAV